MSKNFSFLVYAICFISLGSLLLTPAGAQAEIEQYPQAMEALGKCLQTQEAVMYGAENCGHCKKQKEMFGSYFKYVKYVDCKKNRATCLQAKVGPYPKWTFSNGQYLEREKSLETIANVSGCQGAVMKAMGTQVPNNNQSWLATATAEANTPGDSNSLALTTTTGAVNPETLAKCLQTKGVIFYGSPVCSHCNHNKEMFQGAFEKYLSDNFHNCKGSKQEVQECIKAKATPFPTWIEPNTGKRVTRPENLKLIADTFDCQIAYQQPQHNHQTTNYTVQNQPSSTTTIEDAASNPYAQPSAQPSLDQINQEASTLSTLVNQNENQTNTDDRKLEMVKCLNEKHLTLYLLQGQKASQDQMNELGTLSAAINTVDCSTMPAKCDGIIVFPTWVFEDNKQLPGVYDLVSLCQYAGCAN